jgi:hypothetical protein
MKCYSSHLHHKTWNLNLLSEIWKQATVQDMDCKLEILCSNALTPILLPAGYSTGQLNKHDFHHLDFVPPVKHTHYYKENTEPVLHKGTMSTK